MTDNSNDDLIFFDEPDSAAPARDETSQSRQSPARCWKILIVDDDSEVHSITTLVLKNFRYDGKGLQFLHAYSAGEANFSSTVRADFC